MSTPPNRREFLRRVGALGAVTGLGWGQLGRARAESALRDPAWLDQAPWKDNLFLQGIMRPVSRERTIERCAVTGAIPRELTGLLVRNGPNQRFAPTSDNYHFFDGDGMLHGMWLEDGQASYANRWVRGRTFELQDQAQASLWGSLLDHPRQYAHPRGESFIKPTGSVNAVWHADRLWVLDEMGLPYAADPQTLDTRGLADFAARWKGGFTAHPKIDVATGEMMVFGYNPIQKPHLQYAVLGAEGVLSEIQPIRLPRPVMTHDMWITKRYSVLIDMPVVFSIVRGVLTGDVFKFNPRRGTRFGVIPRHGRSEDIRWFEVAPCVPLHTMAAWEEDDELVLIAPSYVDFAMLDATYNPTAPGFSAADLEALRPHFARLHRWRLDMKTGRVLEDVDMDDRGIEFPRINDLSWGRQTRFGYAMPAPMDHVIKYDLQTGESWEHNHGPGRFGFEPIFVPHPQATAEDHGWVAVYVYDQSTDKSDLVLIDAQRFTEPPVARIHIPQRVPMGPHGTWTPADQLT